MAYSTGSLVGDNNGRFLQKPYSFTTVDDSGTTSPIVVTATSNKIVAPSKAVLVTLQTIGDPIWFKETSTVTSSGDYLATASSIDQPTYPGAEIYMVRATAVDATITVNWKLLA